RATLGLVKHDARGRPSAPRRVSQRALTVYTAGRRARPGARTDRCIRDPDRGATMATYVLVHGAYQGGWIWKPVVERLRTAGHQVHAPTLDACAERHHLVRPAITVATHAQEIAQLLFYEQLARVVLVGTSSGGMVICKAAELARDRIGRLVFVDALALMPGERVGDIVKRVSANEPAVITTGLPG